MEFIKNILHQIWHKKIQTISLTILFFLLFLVILSALSIDTVANRLANEAEETLGARVLLTAKRQAGFERIFADGNKEKLTPEDLSKNMVAVEDAQALADMSEVKNSLLQASAVAISDDVFLLRESLSEDSKGLLSGMISGLNGGTGDFHLSGVSSTKIMRGFSSKSLRIIAGNAIPSTNEASNPVLVESSFAKTNKLKPGSTFTLKDKNEEKTYSVTVNGVYERVESELNLSMSDPASMIYCHYSLANQLSQGSSDHVDSAVYTLTSFDETASFVKEAKTTLDMDKYLLTSHQKIYQLLAQALATVSKVIWYLVFAIAGVSSLIISIILIFKLRKQKLRIKNGEPKSSILVQNIGELFLPVIVAFCLAAAFGNPTVNWLEEWLLSTSNISSYENIEMPEELTEAISESFPEELSTEIKFAELENLQQLFRLDFQVRGREMAIAGGVGLSILCISILAGVFYCSALS